MMVRSLSVALLTVCIGLAACSLVARLTFLIEDVKMEVVRSSEAALNL
jgi:hypothetical protein